MFNMLTYQTLTLCFGIIDWDLVFSSQFKSRKTAKQYTVFCHAYPIHDFNRALCKNIVYP